MPITHTINTTVPSSNLPGAPVLVFYDNGDWEFVCAADIEVIGDFVGYDYVASILTFINTCVGHDEIDQTDEEAFLELDLVENGGEEQTVIVLFDDGEYDLSERGDATDLIQLEGSNVFNFIPLSDFVEEFERFFKTNQRAMFEYDSEPDVSGFFEDED